MSSLLQTSAGHFTDELLQVEDLFTAKHANEANDLLEVDDLENKIHKIDSLLIKLFNSNIIKSQILLSATINFIHQLGGNVNSEQLTHFSGYSERYLEKKFKEHIGIGPKKFARITRLLQYIKTLQTGQQTFTLSRQAHQSGYFDQAHLNHDFKNLTGITPSIYSHHSQSLALNLITLQGF